MVEKIGKREMYLIVKYTIDYDANVGYIEDVLVKTNDTSTVHYPFLVGIMEMAKYYLAENSARAIIEEEKKEDEDSSTIGKSGKRKRHLLHESD